MSWLPTRVVLSAAVVGIVGAAGLYIYEQLYAEKRRAMLAQEMGRLDRQVASLREELQSLRDLQKESSQSRKVRPRRVRPRPPAGEAAAAGAAAAGDRVDGRADASYASDSEYLTDYASIVGTDGEMDSEEFYDVHSDSEREGSRRGSISSRPNALGTPEAVPNGMKPA